MSERPPVDGEVREAIRTRLDETLFVEAAAGTGKTSCLVERVLALVASGVALSSIATITFTEAAASELRARIRARIDERVRIATDSDERARWQEALADVDGAAICTLHAFAQRLLREHPIEAGLPPRVEVHDEVSSQLAFDERWRIFLDDLYSEPDLEQVLERMLVLDIKDWKLRDVAVTFDDNWDRLLEHPPRGEPLGPIDVGPLVAELDEILAECELADPDDQLVRRVSGYAETARSIGGADELDRLALLCEKVPRVGNCGSKRNWPSGYDLPGLRERVKGLEGRRQSLEAEASDAVLRQLAVRIADFTVEAAEERRRSGRLEYHDLLVLARRLLRTSSEARVALSQRYRYLLLDEFQDTDPVQVELAVLLAAVRAEVGEVPWDHLETDRGALFFVGDPKQSIYRFRRADIELFLAARERFAEAGALGLVENFRTVPGVVDFVNEVFGELMGDGIPGVQPAYQRLYAHRAPISHEVPVTLLGGPHAEGNAAEVRAREAADVAATVAAALAERWSVLDAQTGGTRPVRPSDIAILLPARTSRRALERELRRFAIPFRTETGSLVWDTQEVRDLLTVLRAVDDPTDAISLVAALRSPAFACGDDELLAYRQAGGSWDYRLDPPDRLAADHRVVRAMGELAALHRDRWWVGTSRMVERVARERRLFELALADPRPRDTWRHLRFVIDRARAYVESEGGTLRGFLEWAELQSSDVARVAEPIVDEPDDEAVRVLTIHGAKGREFPVVVLSGLTTAAQTPRRAQVHWPTGGGPPEIGVRKDRATSAFDAAREAEDQMDVHEKLRLLYVGMTRARDHLVVSAHHKPPSKSSSDRLRRSFGELVWEQAGRTPGLWVQGRGDDGTVAPLPGERDVPALGDLEGRAAWIERRAGALARRSPTRTISATAIARAVAERAAGVDAGHAEPDPAMPQEEGPELDVADARPWNRGRAGSALGRAVHGVLQHVDLATGEGLEELAAAQAAAEHIQTLTAAVASRARAALDAPVVREALAAPRCWRELYVAAPALPDGGPAIEGYVDLLVARADGLVVVDYKTDGVRSEAEADEAVRRYRLQAAAYAVAVGEVVGEPVVECVLVFLGPRGVLQRSVPDLPGALEEVRGHLAGSRP